ncbi:hypothetical protein D210916BOD24_24510 [Alteromonas sp. D210916BOD_24]|uniref:gluconate 2-dehydrogenase subunit 3 family protein n=1 Tax=Alteromonas sp. D210916BOD_24 TaxID=3157618 RepID=UPI00399D149F
MKRRELLKNSLSVSVGSLALGFVPGVVNGKTESQASDFDAGHKVLMRRISALIIPETHTKGAVATHSDVTALALVRQCSNAAFFNAIQLMFTSLEDAAQIEFSQPASVLDNAHLTDLVTRLDQGQLPFDAELMDTFRKLKQLIVMCYCTSKEGANNELVYLPVPGGYTGSVPYSSVGAAYSSKAYY